MKSLYSLLVIALASMFSSSAHAVYFNVIGPCSERPVHSGSFKTDLDDSVGKISMDIFDFNKIPYAGTEHGMNSIINSPVGLDAMEVISDSKMRAYGWCFSINGVIPDVLASEVHFSKQNDVLTWFYAYSTYDQGVWTDYCVPSYKIKSPQFCK